MWQDKLKLDANESLRHDKSYAKGSLGQEEIELYSIVNQDGEVTGSVQYTDHTAIKGFHRTLHVIQRSSSGNVIVNERWSE